MDGAEREKKNEQNLNAFQIQIKTNAIKIFSALYNRCCCTSMETEFIKPTIYLVGQLKVIYNRQQQKLRKKNPNLPFAAHVLPRTNASKNTYISLAHF